MSVKPGDEIVIGEGRSVKFFSKSLGEDHTVPVSGCVYTHPHSETGEPCRGTLWLSNTGGETPYGVPEFELVADKPLHIRGILKPSVQCKLCSEHGYILDGKWMPA